MYYVIEVSIDLLCTERSNKHAGACGVIIHTQALLQQHNHVITLQERSVKNQTLTNCGHLVKSN